MDGLTQFMQCINIWTLVSTVFQYSAASVSFLRKGFGMANLFWFSKISNSRWRIACLDFLFTNFPNDFPDWSWSLVEYRPRNWTTKKIYFFIWSTFFPKFSNGTVRMEMTVKWQSSSYLKPVSKPYLVFVSQNLLLTKL